MTVSNYSIIASENNSPAPNGAPEGMTPSSVNDTMRVMMASSRILANGFPWFEYKDGTKAGTSSYVSSTKFKITGNDSTAHYHIDRRVKIVGTATVYAKITASSYSAGDTTVTVVLDSGTLINESITVYTSLLTANISAIPENIIQDITGGMVSGNTETGLTVSYTSGKLNFAVDNQTWAQITGKPSTFTPSAHTHPWADVTGEPVYTTRWPTWSEVTSKPSTFTPSSHSHVWADVTGEPVYTTRWPTWSEVTSKPSTFTPSSHTHPWSQLTSIPTNANGNRTVSTSSPSGGSNGDIWYKV